MGRANEGLTSRTISDRATETPGGKEASAEEIFDRGVDFRNNAKASYAHWRMLRHIKAEPHLSMGEIQNRLAERCKKISDLAANMPNLKQPMEVGVDDLIELAALAMRAA